MAIAAGATLRITTFAVTTIATVTAITATKTTFTAGRTLFAGLGFVHAHWTTVQFLIVQCGDCRLSLLCIWHFNEAEAS